ncbi:MAG TPA: hypothetical protein VGH98_25840 [Gemmatimonadaceae bacterium]
MSAQSDLLRAEEPGVDPNYNYRPLADARPDDAPLVLNRSGGSSLTAPNCRRR